MIRNVVLVVIFVLFSGAAHSQAGNPAAEESPWAGSASLGYLATSGNTDTTSYNSAFEVSYAVNKWTHTFDGAANGADESDEATAEAYQAGWKTSYDFSEQNYVFGMVNWRKDRFSGVDQQLSEAFGYGRRLIDTPAHLLSLELGVGHRSADLSDDTEESSAIGTLGVDYKWTFSESSNFEQHIGVESGPDNTYTESVSAVRAKLLGDLAVVFSYTVRNNSDVPIGNEKTDKFTAISVEYAF